MGFKGNSILLQKAADTYIYLGEHIQSFKTSAEIVKYVSPVGNSGVPYPFAVDTDNRFYLMIEDVVLDNVPAEQHEDPYDYYYMMTVDVSIPKSRRSQEDESMIFQGIKKYFIGEEQYTLSYNPNPEK